MSPHLRGLLVLAIIFILVGALAGFFAATVSYLITPYITAFLAILFLYLAGDAHDTFSKLPFPEGEDEEENKTYIAQDVARFFLAGLAFSLGAGSAVVMAHTSIFAIAAVTMATLALAFMVIAAARIIAHILP